MNVPHDRTIHAAARHHATVRPESPAIRYEDRTITFGDLDRESNRTAHALRRAGIGPGDRVAFLGKNSPAYFEIVLAVAKCGAVLVPINSQLTVPEVDHILRDSGAALLFVEEEFRAAAGDALAGLTGLRETVLVGPPDSPGELPGWKAGAPDDAVDPGTGADDPVVQVYTSGTTGLPKGVVLAHRSMYFFNDSMAQSESQWFEWLPQDVSLLSFPGSYMAGLGWFMFSFIAGVPTVVMRSFLPGEAVRLIEQHGVTMTYAAPAMLHMLLSGRGVDRDTFRSLRLVSYGAAPMTDTLLSRCLDVMDCQFAQVYASTETGNVATMLVPADHVPGSPVLRSVGRACPGTELRVTGDGDEPAPPGTIGQVWIRTPARMIEYWGMPEATARTLTDGWLRMGDAGYMDEQGYLYLADRIDDTIIVAGQNIYPAEVEAALSSHPAVGECAVVGAPDAQWGEAVCAFVVLAADAEATPRELMRHLRGRIADFKTPTRYLFVDALPRNSTGKVLRRVLREQLRPQEQPAAATAGAGAPATSAAAP